MKCPKAWLAVCMHACVGAGQRRSACGACDRVQSRACMACCVQILYNGVYYEPPEGKSRPGELHPNKSYTFKYPRPPKCACMQSHACMCHMRSGHKGSAGQAEAAGSHSSMALAGGVLKAWLDRGWSMRGSAAGVRAAQRSGVICPAPPHTGHMPCGHAVRDGLAACARMVAPAAA